VLRFCCVTCVVDAVGLLVYNMHSLIHTVDDVVRFGPLNTISCFPFENHLRLLKKLVRKAEMPLQQIVWRIFEQNVWKSFVPLLATDLVNTKHENGPVPDEAKSLPNIT